MRKNLILLLLLLPFTVQYTVAQESGENTLGYAKFAKGEKFKPFRFKRHAVGDNEILIDIMYAGVCHTDIHMTEGHLGETKYPLVPGHEILGKISHVGRNVTKFKVGDYAGVGTMINSCGHCEYCKRSMEQYCLEGTVGTYGAIDRFHDGEYTQGGYSQNIVVSEKFAVKIPKGADLKRVAPLLCAGTTTYSAMKHNKFKSGDSIAIAGFGGLGSIALKYAVKWGAKVTVFDITEDKRTDAMKMGAVNYVNVKNADELKGLNNKFKSIFSTIPTSYDLPMYQKMLKLDGELVVIGVPPANEAPKISTLDFVSGGTRKVSGSITGGMAETQEMLNYSVKENIYPDVEIISMSQIDEAYRNVLAGKVKYRYVIDMSKLK